MKRTGQSPEQDQYRALMDDIEMPGRVHDRVMREAHRLRTAEAVHAKPTRRPRTCNQSGYRTRRFVTAVIAAACVLALASGVADNAPDSGQRYLSVAHLFDLSCTGTNVASLTYTVEGDRVLFYTNARMPEFSYQEGDDPYTEDRTTSFTVNYDEQNANKTEIWHALRVSFPLEGEVAELYDATTGEFYGDRRKWDVNMHENLNALLIRKYADMIAQARLKVTATYDDGTTETKTYVITPVDNLEETLRAYGEALRAQAAEEEANPGPTEPIARPQLFRFTQID